MVVTSDVTLPSDEELTVPEVQVSSAILRSAAFHLGKYCENVNNVCSTIDFDSIYLQY